MTKNEEKAIEILKNTRQAWCRILSRYIDNQQKEIEEMKEEHIESLNARYNNFISKNQIREIRDKAEVMDYYSLNDVIDDLSKLIGDYEEDD